MAIDRWNSTLRRTDHRPWPLPSGRWAWRQSWCDLLFAHWPVAAKRLRHLVPAPLQVQEFDGTSWIGVVPFRMEGVMRRPFPDLPWISAFPELNLRLYVECGGRAGVWFLSLDASNPLAVWAARRFFHLPYHWSEMETRRTGSRVRYRSVRRAEPQVDFRASYGPTSDRYEAEQGTLEHWLTERYCLFARAPNGALYRADVHHHPWPLQRASAEIERNGLLEPHGLECREPPALLHFAERIDVVVWEPTRISAAGQARDG